MGARGGGGGSGTWGSSVFCSQSFHGREVVRNALLAIVFCLPLVPRTTANCMLTNERERLSPKGFQEKRGAGKVAVDFVRQRTAIERDPRKQTTYRDSEGQRR